jgi:hypothetical protein
MVTHKIIKYDLENQGLTLRVGVEFTDDAIPLTWSTEFLTSDKSQVAPQIALQLAQYARMQAAKAHAPTLGTAIDLPTAADPTVVAEDAAMHAEVARRRRLADYTVLGLIDSDGVIDAKLPAGVQSALARAVSV